MKSPIPILLVILLVSCATNIKQKLTFVYDIEQILTEEQEKVFTTMFTDHEKKTTNEIVLVTTPDWGESGNALIFSVDFGNDYGIGKHEKDNGVIIVFSQKQRETRIATGYGTELVLTDDIAKKYIDSLMIPEFKEDQIFDGLFHGSRAIINFLEKPENEIKTVAKKSK